MKKLSWREKRDFYHGLGRLLRSGTPFPAALDLLARDATGAVRNFSRRLGAAVLAGADIAEAFARDGATTEIERSIIGAASRSGQMDRACEQLENYFEAFEEARKTMVKKSLYPIVLLHLAVFLASAPRLFLGSLREYSMYVIGCFTVIYLVALGIYFAFDFLSASARSNPGTESFLRMVPGVGKIRRDFALARFCASLDAQLEASVNVWESFAIAARTSGSARMISCAQRAVNSLQSGERLGDVIADSGIFPAEAIRAFRIAEETGELDQELPRLAREFEGSALTRLESWSEWLPKIVYGLVMLYVGYQIVSGYQRIAASYGQMIDGM